MQNWTSYTPFFVCYKISLHHVCSQHALAECNIQLGGLGGRILSRITAQLLLKFGPRDT